MDNSISIVNEVVNVIKQRTNLSYLYNSVAEGIIHANKGFIDQSSQNGLLNRNNQWIRLIRLNKVSFNKWIGYKRNYGSRYDDTSRYLSLFNKNFNVYSGNGITPETAFYMGVNIDSNIKLTGYHFNICDIFNSRIFSESDRSIRDYIGNYIYKLLYVTEKNFLIGFIDTNAVLYIDNVILQKLLETSFDDFVRVVDRIISVYANANSAFFSINNHTVQDDISEIIIKRLLTTINHDCKDCTIIPPDHVDLFEDFSVVSSLVNKLISTVKSQVNLMLDGTRWGINNQFTYKQLLDDILVNKYQLEEKSLERSFLQGLLYGSKFELAGWQISDKKFEDDISVCWEKDVEIVPTRFFYNKKMYIIDESSEQWQNPFKITKLFVSGSGRMFCEGKHPNVSGGKVCMGDISGKINMSDVKKLQSNLARCEALLTSINYDSPYDSSYRDTLMQHAHLQELESGHNADSNGDDEEYIAQGTVIQDIVFEDDDPENKDVENDSDLHDSNYQDSEVQPLDHETVQNNESSSENIETVSEPITSGTV